VRLGQHTSSFDGAAAIKDSGMGDRDGAAWDGHIASIDGPRGVEEVGSSVGEDSVEAAREVGAPG
jgi:hypothetical protein